MKPGVLRRFKECACDYVEIKIELAHGRFAQTEVRHARSSWETINEQHACMHALDRGCTLLDLLTERENKVKATYSLPDVHTNQSGIAHMAGVVQSRFREAASNQARLDGNMVVTTAFAKTEITYSKHMIVGVFPKAEARLVDGTIKSLEKQNSLSTLLPHDKLFASPATAGQDQ